MATGRNSRTPENPSGFYSQGLNEAEQLKLEEACRVEGLDEEIALLRLQLRRLLKEQPDMHRLHIQVISAIARLVKIRYEVTRDHDGSLKAAIEKVFTEVAVPLGLGVDMKIANQ